MTRVGCRAGAAGRDGVERLERIGGAGVFGQRQIVEVGLAARLVEHDILEHRAEALGRGEDLGLGGGAEVGGLGVAAALDIGDAVAAPQMLVVADQRPRRDRS